MLISTPVDSIIFHLFMGNINFDELMFKRSWVDWLTEKYAYPVYIPLNNKL